jgi:Txe/YoeB family toxin of Txe-Axe toxin-antitoxin module
MASREINTENKKRKEEALELLWEDIEKALLQSPSVRLSLTNYQAMTQISGSLKNNIILNIDDLMGMVEDEEAKEKTAPESNEDKSPEEVSRRIVKELRSHLIKSIQTNLNLVESSTKLSIQNKKLQKELDQLGQKHHKALENIEKILMNITRNPN